MNNEQLLDEVRKDACSCDAMLGWTCHFCKYTLPKLRKALVGKSRTMNEFGEHQSAYKPKRLPRPHYVEEKRSCLEAPYMPKRIRRALY